MAKQPATYESSELRSDQLAPHSAEAEQAVLGAILINPEALYEVIPFLTPDDFFIVRYGWIFKAMIDLHDRREYIEHLTVTEELEQSGKLAEVGGAAHLLWLIGQTPSALNTEGYGRIVERMALRRRLIDAAGQIARVAHSEETDISIVVGKAEEAIFSVTQAHQTQGVRSMHELASAVYDDAIAANRSGTVPGLRTYLKDIDTLMGGMRGGDLIIVGARPGMGKSSFLHGIFAESSRAGVPVALLSIEEGDEQVTQRLVAAETGIPYERIAAGNIYANELQAFTDATNQVINRWPSVIDSSPELTPMDVRVKLRRFQFEYGIELAMIDYIQLMTGGPKFAKSDNRVQEISFISRELKKIARELNIPIVAAAQLSRKVEERSDKRPMRSDLRESGSLEQDTDKIGFLYLDKYYYPDSPAGDRTEFHLAKNRRGPTGMVEILFQPVRMRFVDAARIDLNDIAWGDNHNGDKQHEQVSF
jgi:replicative DNA helicase